MAANLLYLDNTVTTTLSKIPKNNTKEPTTRLGRKPRAERTKKIVEVAQSNPNLTMRQIASIAKCDHSYVVRVLQRYQIDQEHTAQYKKNRADVFAGLQDRILKSITPGDIRKASASSKVMMAGILYDKERLERGQATQITDYRGMNLTGTITELREALSAQ